MQRKYYEAYDDRYRQVHAENLQWFHHEPSAVVMETMNELSVSRDDKILEIGCGEGRDAFLLLEQGFDLLATDVSPEAIRFCKDKSEKFADRFQVLDCISGKLDEKFDFIYAVAVLHMLVQDDDRNAFYSFICRHLKQSGRALICTMGDGNIERSSDISKAFDIQERLHEQTGRTVKIASTSCRMVTFETFESELIQNSLTIIKKGVVSIEPDFTHMMFAVVEK